MTPRIGQLFEELSRSISALPDVFSAPQWGGRAYKLPGPGGNLRKPKLLAFVVIAGDGKSIGVGFKLPKERAAEMVDRYDWIQPHSFGSLGRAGWVEARLTRKKDLTTIERLLRETRALFPVATSVEVAEGDAKNSRAAAEKSNAEKTKRSSRSPSPSSTEARRIDEVMTTMRPEGWTPGDHDDF